MTKDSSDSDGSIDDKSDVKKEKMISCWQCPLCSMVYKRRFHFDKHVEAIHNLQPDEVSDAWKTSMLKDEFEQKLIQVDRDEKEARKRESEKQPPRSDWGREAFSTRFSCHFCGEVFKRDCNYVIHLQLQHRGEDQETIEELVADIHHFKLDGCEFTCAICGGKYVQHSSFMRHTKNHGITYKEYQDVHGSPETSSSSFECRLCMKTMKRTRNIITTHMKAVHFLSWGQYRDKTCFGVKKEAADADPLEAAPRSPRIVDSIEMFECVLCDSRVKGKKQHLTRIHNIEQEVYELYVSKRQLGEQVPELETCKICDRVVIELRKHVKHAHRMEHHEYAATDFISSNSAGEFSCNIADCSAAFHRESELLIHLDIKHPKTDDSEKLEVKNAILRNSEAQKVSAKLLCKVCGAGYSSRSSLWGHVTRTHSLTWQDYEASFGHVEKDIETLEPVTCKVCQKGVKNEKNVILRHIKNKHNLTWSTYVANYVKNNNFLQGEESKSLKNSKNKKKSHKKKKSSTKRKFMSESEDEYMGDLVKSEVLEKRTLPVRKISKLSESEDPQNFSDFRKDLEAELQWSRGELQAEMLLQKSPTPSPEKSDFTLSTKLMNVTDKSLKSCSRCQIDFPSRLRFIRHCQVTHNMKFKLKNGDKLTLP